MSLQQDFDRIALVSTDGATRNDYHHNYLLRHLPTNCRNALEIGCGTGTFSRRLAEHFNDVHAIDLSPQMIRIARERSVKFPNIEFELADVRERPLQSFRGGHCPSEADTGFDCIATIATLHHLPFEEMLLKMKAALKPGGVLLILDLFEPKGVADFLSNFVAVPVSVALRLLHHRRLLPRREERDAWKAHEHHDLYPTMREVRDVCARILPGAKIKQHLLWRYSIVWTKVAQI